MSLDEVQESERGVLLHYLGRIREALIQASEGGLKLPDCCVLFAAEQVAGSVATFEDRLAGAARARGLEVLQGPRCGCSRGSTVVMMP